VTFLTPIPAIIAAAIAVPLLVVFYLLKLRRKPVRVSSILFWTAQKRDLQANVPLRMLRPSWLLLLQLLGLALLLLALARPAINLEGAPASGVILVIDRSASMSALDEAGGPSRLVRAQRAALEQIDRIARAGRGSEVMVVSLAARAEAATPMSSDLSAARRAVEALTPTDQPADLDAALALVEAVVIDRGSTDETVEAEPAEVVLLSDGSFETGASRPISGAQTRYIRIGPRDAPPDSVATPDNVGIVALAARRDYEDPATVRVFARVVNAAEREVDLPATLSLDGEAVERRPLRLPAATRNEGGDIVPSPDGVSFELATRAGGVLTLELGREDALAADNASSLVLAAAPSTSIILVTPEESSRADRIAEGILADVLSELADGGFQRLTADDYAARARGAMLPPADLFVFDRVRPVLPPPAPSITIGVPIPFDLEARPPEDAASSPTYTLTWEREHPVLRDVALDTLYTEHTVPLTLPSPEAEGEQDSFTPLALGRSGPLLAESTSGGVRRLAIAFELARSNWPTDPSSFAIFLANAVDFLTLRGEATVGRAFTTAEPVFLEVETADEPVLIGPEGADEPRSQRIRRTETGVTAGLVPRAGLYTLRAGGEALGRVAVNLHDEIETMARSMPSLRISGRDVVAQASGEAPREVWPWFVLAALVVLSGEWLLSAWLSRV